jgi:hypothetical protein
MCTHVARDMRRGAGPPICDLRGTEGRQAFLDSFQSARDLRLGEKPLRGPEPDIRESIAWRLFGPWTRRRLYFPNFVTLFVCLLASRNGIYQPTTSFHTFSGVIPDTNSTKGLTSTLPFAPAHGRCTSFPRPCTQSNVSTFSLSPSLRRQQNRPSAKHVSLDNARQMGPSRSSGGLPPASHCDGPGSSPGFVVDKAEVGRFSPSTSVSPAIFRDW